jgi:hypothetical protein
MSDTISIIGREDRQERAPLGRIEEWRYKHEEVPIEKIKNQLSDFLDGMQRILDGVPNTMTNYELESIDISVEVSSKGNISLLAIGGELGSTGGLTLHLKKRSPSENLK